MSESEQPEQHVLDISSPTKKKLLRDIYLYHAYIGQLMGGFESTTIIDLMTRLNHMRQSYPVIYGILDTKTEEEKNSIYIQELENQKNRLETTMKLNLK